MTKKASTMIIADAGKEKDQVLSVDIGKCYQFKPEDFDIEVTSEHYANNSFIQVMNQDVFIDFMSIPGIKKEGKMVASATRIYMTHVQAAKLARSLQSILQSTHEAGRMETYPPKKL
jgi:hypothetical protein